MWLRRVERDRPNQRLCVCGRGMRVSDFLWYVYTYFLRPWAAPTLYGRMASWARQFSFAQLCYRARLGFPAGCAHPIVD